MSSSPEQSGKLPFTFGIEIEFLFGVDNVQVSSDPAHRHLLVENSIIHDDDLYDPEFEVLQVADLGDVAGLFQAATVLRRNGADLLIRTEAKSDDEDFSRWTMTLEAMVPHPESDSQLAALTDGKYRRVVDCSFAGLELISPILKVPDMTNLEPNGLVEVNQFLQLMAGEQPGPCFFSATPKNASVHVHIGVPPTPEGDSVDIPLNALRHLAWICIAFEDVITLLHHPERHGYVNSKIWPNAQPNRVFLGRNDPLEPLHNCAEKGRPFYPQEEFAKIFNFEYCDEDMDRKELKHLLCFRMGPLSGYPTERTFVNFANIVPFPGDPAHAKKTIEFRQHHGTLSAEDISEWVLFVTALVRAAERKADESPSQTDLPVEFIDKVIEAQGNYAKQLLTFQQAWKYADILHCKERSMKELFDLLELPLERRQYWWNRAMKFASEEFLEYRRMSTCDPPCQNLPMRDCAGWEEGELIPQPWDTVQSCRSCKR
ncbi:hypothetical protein A1O1_01331 [Capronia coronata CBS 617.96]|uniref:Amidoligase enzyme n=1 Tax=Capronia coronata CBS 617.96 TaxID=1182541 RepID=W9Z2L1_9EURO|nr:uncharacterized protein A1O1_01331 [Capronia coronata CBS 617.96]EXJ96205.1 hypothetical protein A1O1_01331 [Capronia coronata CBS 617.96]